MRDASGTPCPMHRGNAPSAHADHAATHAAPDAPDAQRQAPRDCVMRGTCHGQTFVSVLSYPGILPDVLSEPVPPVTPGSSTDLRQQTLAGVVAPDPHPPRA